MVGEAGLAGAGQAEPAGVADRGGQAASHGRITKQGRAHARGMLVEAAWVAVKTPGPLRAFYGASGRGAACRSPSWPPPAS